MKKTALFFILMPLVILSCQKPKVWTDGRVEFTLNGVRYTIPNAVFTYDSIDTGGDPSIRSDACIRVIKKNTDSFVSKYAFHLICYHSDFADRVNSQKRLRLKRYYDGGMGMKYWDRNATDPYVPIMEKLVRDEKSLTGNDNLFDCSFYYNPGYTAYDAEKIFTYVISGAAGMALKLNAAADELYFKTNEEITEITPDNINLEQFKKRLQNPEPQDEIMSEFMPVKAAESVVLTKERAFGAFDYLLKYPNLYNGVYAKAVAVKSPYRDLLKYGLNKGNIALLQMLYPREITGNIPNAWIKVEEINDGRVKGRFGGTLYNSSGALVEISDGMFDAPYNKRFIY